MSGVSEAERLARVVLSRVSEPGEAGVLQMVGELGAERALTTLAGDEEIPGLESDLGRLVAGVDPGAELERARRQGIRFVVPGDEEWPAGLDDLAHVDSLQGRGGVPVGLWVSGPVALAEVDRPEAPGVAIVGSRSCSTYGASVARELAADVARHGSVVVSGAAAGIDQAAHRGAIAVGGTTVAVLACGADRVYPAAHRDLIGHIRRTGAVVSETPPGGAPHRIRFLGRNRLIAALCSGTVLVEAAVRSGALNTANWTDRLSRPLMGVPGPVTSICSQGVHQQIRDGAAVLVSGGPDVLEMVGLSGDHLVEAPRDPPQPRDGLDRRQQRVLEAVPLGRPVGLDSVATAAGMKTLEVTRCLLRLADLGFVERRDTGWVLGAQGRI